MCFNGICSIYIVLLGCTVYITLSIILIVVSRNLSCVLNKTLNIKINFLVIIPDIYWDKLLLIIFSSNKKGII